MKRDYMTKSEMRECLIKTRKYVRWMPILEEFWRSDREALKLSFDKKEAETMEQLRIIYNSIRQSMKTLGFPMSLHVRSSENAIYIEKVLEEGE